MSAPDQPVDYAAVVCDTLNANLRNPRTRTSPPTYYPLIAGITGTVKFADGTETTFSISTESEANWQQKGTDPDHTIGDQLTAFSTALREYNAENTPTHHFHVGSNLAGYLPEGDVQCFVDLDDALTCLKAELERSAAAMGDCIHSDQDGAPVTGWCMDSNCVTCVAYSKVEQYTNKIDADAEEADPSTEDFGLSYELSDGRTLPLAFWVQRVKAADCEIEQES